MSTQFGGAAVPDQAMMQQGQAPAGPVSTDPNALVQQLLALAGDDQAQLQAQQMMEQQALADAQKQAMIQALQALMQGLGGDAQVAVGADAAAPPADDYQGVAPTLPADALSQLPQAGAPASGEPVLQPDEIPPQFG